MAKNTHWFKHDYNARRDPKLIRLARIKGMKGLGIYWSLIEILHEQDGEILIEEIPDISFELREDENNVLSILKEFDLFVIQQNKIGNTRVSDSLHERGNRVVRAKENINHRWGNKEKKQSIENQNNNTTVIPNEYQDNTIREEKRREEKIYIPSEGEFLDYCKSLPIEYDKYLFALKAKYDTWKSDNWKDGRGKQIKNWKNTIRNTIPYLKKMNTSQGEYKWDATSGCI